MAETKKTFEPKKWCGIPGCGTSIERKQFACPNHWKKIPAEIRAKILTAFKKREWMTLQEGHNEARAALAVKGVK